MPIPRASSPRARALEALEGGPAMTFPLRECLRRGFGEVSFLEGGCVALSLPDGDQMIWADPSSGTALAAGERMVASLLRPTFCTLLCPGLLPAVRRRFACEVLPFRVAVFGRGDPPPVALGKAVRTIGEEHAQTVLDHYAHGEYFSVGDVVRMMRAGTFLGGFDDSGEMVGYIGEHVEGAMGMLEVFEGHRRQGWGRALEGALIRRTLERGDVPWVQVLVGNAASEGLQASLGLETLPGTAFFLEFP